MEDGALARAVTIGSAAAETELCRRFATRVRAYGLRHLRDRAAADDLVQSVLVLVLEKLRRGEVSEPGRLASFLLGVCRNTVLDLNKTQRRRTAILEEAEPALVELARGAIGATDWGLDRERLGTCLQALSHRELTVVMLTFFAERSGAEIAAELGTTPGNVRVARHRALAALRDCMTEGQS